MSMYKYIVHIYRFSSIEIFADIDFYSMNI